MNINRRNEVHRVKKRQYNLNSLCKPGFNSLAKG